jgi:hypothetical protein
MIQIKPVSGFFGHFFPKEKSDTVQSSESVDYILLNNSFKDYWQLYAKRNMYQRHYNQDSLNQG